MSANDRIQWLHKRISENSYPRTEHLTKKFSISKRQAQRDIEYMKVKLQAPIAFSHQHKGYFYTEPYVLPFIREIENDADIQDVLTGIHSFEKSKAERSELQLQLPYTALLEIKDIMTVLNLRSLIVADEPHHRYRCEFPSVELFLGIIMSTSADIKVIEPEWLRQKLVDFAKRVLKNNETKDAKK
jgi:predicted DNA-binding transcriptional regulator YafY